jgi:hypothetical protein
MLIFLSKKRTLIHAEAVLFVSHHKPGACKLNAVTDKRLSAYHGIYLTRRKRGVNAFFYGGRHRAHKQRNSHTKTAKQRGKISIMLCGEYFGRRHKSRLHTVFNGNIDSRRRAHGLTAANVTNHHSIHSVTAAHILFNRLNGTLLSVSQLVRERRFKASKIGIRTRDSRHGITL